jgi:YidC/Oxa1 family membrane protein insertase
VNKRIFQLYKEENVNLAGGCLPMLVMMVVLFPVFWMVRDYEYQFTNGHFLWIGSQLAERFSWIGKNLAQFDMPLFIIYLLSTVAYSLLQPKPADPQQAQQQKMMLFMMPIMFGVMMFWYKWSSAFMLYWLILNLVSMYQSWVLMKQFGLATPGTNSSGSGGGGGGGESSTPASPLEPMKGVQARKPANGRNGRNGRGLPTATPDRIRPKGSGRRR